MEQYHTLLRRVLEYGTHKADRTGTGTLSLFGAQLRFNLWGGFPLLTTKRMWWRGIVEELLWMLRGSTNARELEVIGVDVWKEWGHPTTRELGPVYGALWREWPSVDSSWNPAQIRTGIMLVDQLANFLVGLATNPESRRHIIFTWHPGLLEQQALPPCHGLVIQGYVVDGKLSIQVYQRSADAFLGLPWNIASYALLTHMVAQVAGLVAHELVHTLGDAHLYLNHVEQARLLLSREPRPLPRLRLNPEVKDLFAFRYEDIAVVGYEPHAAIAAPVAV